MTIPAAIALAVLVYVGIRVATMRRHRARMMTAFRHRIHVNGIRGKSSVTRLIAAALREGGVPTVAKTTGTAARLITGHTTERVIQRKEADIAEQKKILDTVADGSYQAVVFECMAINPIYQRYLEDKVMFSTIGVITNVREDHTDVMGRTLPEIAQALSSSVPRNGHLVTAETAPDLLAILGAVCGERGTMLHIVDGRGVGDGAMASFDHFEYKSNVAIALEVAALVGIERTVALRGMHQALPDPGSFVVRELREAGRTIHWANLFAINDRESFILTFNELAKRFTPRIRKAVILNNRADRPERVAQFVDVVLNQVRVDCIITFGDYERQVEREIGRHPLADRVTFLPLGNSTRYRTADGALLFKRIADVLDEESMLFGAVNIHTPQAAALLARIEDHAH